MLYLTEQFIFGTDKLNGHKDLQKNITKKEVIRRNKDAFSKDVKIQYWPDWGYVKL